MKKLLFCLIVFCSPAMAAQTTWYAGSSYKGTVTVPIESGPNVVWKCNGRVCSMSGPWGNALSLDSCQSLVLRIGKISYYKNSAGAIWNARSTELAQCNQVAR
ncbi:hypothetical protein [Acinetobacter proteolyticus]|uniref:Uncharacterized protein n=1 Tax=Acinetobacter proteolyticus TaxID=1776741 RepID=A0A2N0WBU5_9GAMM|nr:hypothetical protein [Acinetobacter proteolyticus]PKF31979.1 hypothetical protein CW311_17245 [Acinetobacter proteolyticus]